jgi:hypothetical protein
MVASVKFYSGKDINLRRAMPFSVAIVFLLALLLISIEPPIVLWGVMLAYGVSGYVRWVVHAGGPSRARSSTATSAKAIEEGNLTGLARMLATTPPGSVLTAEGTTLLMLAVEESNLPAAELLVARGAPLDARDSRA